MVAECLLGEASQYAFTLTDHDADGGGVNVMLYAYSESVW